MTPVINLDLSGSSMVKDKISYIWLVWPTSQYTDMLQWTREIFHGRECARNMHKPSDLWGMLGFPY